MTGSRRCAHRDRLGRGAERLNRRAASAAKPPPPPRKPPPPPPAPPKPAAAARRRAVRALARVPDALRPRAALVEVTMTLSPALSPLTTCVVLSPTTPVWTRCGGALAVALDGHRGAAQRLAGHGEPGDARDDDVGRRAHPGLEAVGRLVERDRHRVADRARAGRPSCRGEHADRR